LTTVIPIAWHCSIAADLVARSRDAIFIAAVQVVEHLEKHVQAVYTASSFLFLSLTQAAESDSRLCGSGGDFY
jgi:hypothetical protein